jgi:hypothetical protein
MGQEREVLENNGCRVFALLATMTFATPALSKVIVQLECMKEYESGIDRYQVAVFESENIQFGRYVMQNEAQQVHVIEEISVNDGVLILHDVEGSWLPDSFATRLTNNPNYIEFDLQSTEPLSEKSKQIVGETKVHGILDRQQITYEVQSYNEKSNYARRDVLTCDILKGGDVIGMFTKLQNDIAKESFEDRQKEFDAGNSNVKF